MKHVIATLLALITAPALAQDFSIRSTDTLPDAEALTAQIHDRDLIYFDDGVSRYNSDGTYAWTYSEANGSGIWPGTYAVTDNVICIAFESGAERCDMFVLSNGRLTLLTDDGQRYPVREIR
ncbi:MAG: hypothetical protein AAGL89_02610 [Pseudomonadota bacterium]